MIGRQLDLFGGPPKPPKNIVIEDEPEVQEPATVLPEPPAADLQKPDDAPEITVDSMVEDSGIHVQMPVMDYEEPSFLPEVTPDIQEKEDEGFKLNESAEDFTLEEAIAAELVSAEENGSENPALEVSSPEEPAEEEIPHVDQKPEEPAAEDPIAGEPAVEEPMIEEAAAEEPEVEEPIIEEAAAEEPEAEEPIFEEAATEEPEVEEPIFEEAATEEPEAEQPIIEEAATEEPEAEEPIIEEAATEEPATDKDATSAFVQTETWSEPAAEWSPDVSFSDPEMQEALVGAEIMEEEPDWVTGELPDSEPELVLEPELDTLPEESAADLVLTTDSARVVEEAHEPVGEVTGEATEAEASEGSEVGPLNIPSDQALYSRQYYTMRETANMFNVNQSLLRFWENEFDILKPKKNRKGDRYFRPDDIKNLELIYHLLRVRKFTISGAKDYLKNKAKSLDTFVMVQRLEKLKLFLQELKTHA